MSEWQLGQLGDFITLQRGFDITQKSMSGGNIPVISSGGISGYHDKAMAKAPGVVTGRKGTLGKVYYVDSDYWPHDTTLWVKDFKRNHPRFVYYFLQTLDFLSMDVGSSNPTLNRNHVHPIPVVWPPLPEQRAIAHILGTLDDKIELNRRMNAELEATARAIFKSWFVDFDPVYAKMRGEQPEGMDAEIAALFPDALVESALGDIPAGWEAAPLSEVIELISGGTPKTAIDEYWDGDIPWFSVKDMPDEGNVFAIETERYITELGLQNSAAKILPIYTIIITARGTVGKLAVTGVPMAMNQSCYGIRGVNDYPEFYTYFLIKAAIGALQQRTHGTVFDTITRETFSTVLVPVPPLEIAVAFEYQIAPYMARMKSSLFESRTLIELRDALLPKLVSGQIRVEEAEDFIAGVAE